MKQNNIQVKKSFKKLPRPQKNSNKVITGNFGKGFLANSEYCLLLNEINCKPKNDKSLEKN